jgi:hypothetical protein
MKNTWKWIVGTVVILALLFALPYLLRAFTGYEGMMGRYTGWHHPMMGGYNYSPLGGLWMGIGMLLAWIIPLGILFLVIYGAVRLANRPDTPLPSHPCANCGKGVQADWKNCPYCGAAL